jgi:hypothetical protein
MSDRRDLIAHIALLIAVLASLNCGQSREPEKPAATAHPAGAVVPAKPNDGPTLADTKAWLESDGAAMLHSYRRRDDRRFSMIEVTTDDASDVQLTDCVLSWKHTTNFKILGAPPGVKNGFLSSAVYRVPLKDVDVAGVLVQSDSSRRDKPVSVVEIKTRAGAGATIAVEPVGKSAKKTEPARAVQIHVLNHDDGERVMKAVRRAAALCGAPTSPF